MTKAPVIPTEELAQEEFGHEPGRADNYPVIVDVLGNNIYANPLTGHCVHQDPGGVFERLPHGLGEEEPRAAYREGGSVSGVAIEVVDKGELVCVAESIALEALGEAVQGASEYHGAVADLFFPARQTKGVHLNSALGKSLFVGEVAVVGEVDVLEGADDEADVLWEDERFACEASGLAGAIRRIYDLLKLVPSRSGS